ncbi:hypothetical protein CIP100629_02209 [Corynebacterium diphtheriae]|nr:hypothetical protein CIP100629_02209 [Corynebacterium diphtheriae]CAB0970048.1 hypothetical protein FRC0463_02028 [Corynebacterium diphtheriae]
MLDSMPFFRLALIVKTQNLTLMREKLNTLSPRRVSDCLCAGGLVYK